MLVSSSAARSILVFTLPDGVLVFAFSDASSSITGNCCLVDLRPWIVLVSGMVEYSSNRWYKVFQHFGVSSLISSMRVFSAMAGDDVSGISRWTESLRLRLRGGVRTPVRNPGDFRSVLGPFLVSLVNLMLAFFWLAAILSLSGRIVSNGSLNEDSGVLARPCFSVSKDLESDVRFV